MSQGRQRFDGTTNAATAMIKGTNISQKTMIYSFNSDSMLVLTEENSLLIL
jgi:hypothetical protein